MSKLIDIEGQRFGLLQVGSYAGSKFRGRAARAAWHCVCGCGARLVVAGAKLRSGETKSCGCIRRWNGDEPIREPGAAGVKPLKQRLGKAHRARARAASAAKSSTRPKVPGE